jgi:hypothetical protein
VQNLCFSINPYCIKGDWFFDDPKVGLFREGLTCGTPEVLLKACNLKSINGSFTVLFSNFSLGEYFLNFKKPLRDGNLYFWHEQKMSCWFCPALLKYFSSPPQKIWFQLLK